MILRDYLSWHYGVEFRAAISRSFSLLRTAATFFSILPLLRTLGSPWHRLVEPYQYRQGFSFGEFFWLLASNLVSRVLGAIVRSVVIALGVVALAMIIVLRGAYFAFWLALPAFIAALFLFGVSLLFNTPP